MCACDLFAANSTQDPSLAEFHSRLRVDGAAEDGGALNFRLLNASHLPIVHTTENVKEDPISLPPYVDLSFFLQPL